MSRISRCGETRGIPHGRTPASSPSRARDDERGGRRARPSPKRGARARAGSSPVHRRFMAGSWLVHGRVTRARRDAGGRGRLPQNRPGADRRPDDAGRRAAPAERTHRSNSPVEHTDQIRRSHLSVEHTDRTCRSNSPLKFVDHTCRSNTPTELAGRTHRPSSPRDGPRYCVAPCSPCIAAGFGAARSRIPISAATIANAAPSMNAAW